MGQLRPYSSENDEQMAGKLQDEDCSESCRVGSVLCQVDNLDANLFNHAVEQDISVFLPRFLEML